VVDRSFVDVLQQHLLRVVQADRRHHVQLFLLLALPRLLLLFSDESFVAVDQELFVEHRVQLRGHVELFQGLLLVRHAQQQEEGVGDSQLYGFRESGLVRITL